MMRYLLPSEAGQLNIARRRQLASSGMPPALDLKPEPIAEGVEND
jgi:hypothetical protein